jgi:hypothetical protein
MLNLNSAHLKAKEEKKNETNDCQESNIHNLR